MKKLSTLLIIAGILVAAFPIYQIGYSYYWQAKLESEMVALDGIYTDLQTDYENSDTPTEPAETPVEPGNSVKVPGEPENPVETVPPVEITPPAEPAANANPSTEPAAKPAATKSVKAIGTLSIPKINLKLPIVSGITKANLNRGVAWMDNSGKIGKNGNAVIAGHRGYTRGRLFNRLNEIKVNDTFSIKTKEGTLNYKVYEIKIVLPSDISVLSQPKSKEVVTLITCTPLYKSTHRIIIKASRVK